MNLSIFPSFHLFKSHRGFTLVEMIVVLSLISLILAVILGSQSKYSDRINVKNHAYKVDRFVRQAQVYSRGVKSTSGAGISDFNTSYGVSFQTTAPNSF